MMSRQGSYTNLNGANAHAHANESRRLILSKIVSVIDEVNAATPHARHALYQHLRNYLSSFGIDWPAIGSVSRDAPLEVQSRLIDATHCHFDALRNKANSQPNSNSSTQTICAGIGSIIGNLRKN